MPLRLVANDPGFGDAFAAFLETKREVSEEVGSVVADIIEDVRRRGDDAVIDYTKRFDAFELTADTLRISRREIDTARVRAESD